MPALAAINYLIPPPGYLWHWSDDGSAVEGADDTTLGWWVELHALLTFLSPDGLPPFGSILLVLTACSRRQTAALTAIKELMDRCQTSGKGQAGGKTLLNRVANVLESIAALPEDLRTGLPARAHLLSRLFEGTAHRQSPEASADILRLANQWGVKGLTVHRPRLGAAARLLRDLNALTAIHGRHDLTKLEPLLRTGIAAVNLRPSVLPEPETAPGESTQPLLRQLETQRDPELACLAAAARRMVALFALPRPAGAPMEMPVGGISDITNRGPLDRLLPSELAADDLLLMARLANNEALYFRRDSPPEEPSSERIILMDSGIHLWGVPRLFALSAALGLQAAVTDSTSIFLREGKQFHPIRLETVSGVRACLERLPPDPDAAAALAKFAPGENPVRRPDVFFLTVPGARGPVVRELHALACRTAAAGGRFYVITFSRSGAVEVSVRTPAGTRPAATGRIDPDEILCGPAVPAAPPPTDRLTDLPALIRDLDFHRQYPLPFRFPAVPLDPSREFRFAHWRLNVDTTRRLMMWDDNPLHGAGEIASGLPPARRYDIGREGEEWIVLCSGRAPGEKVRVVSLGMKEPTRRGITLDSSHPFPWWMKCQHGAAILGYSYGAEACSLTDGTRLSNLALTEGTWPGSVVFDGQRLALAAPPPGPAPKPEPVKEVPAPPAVLAAPVSAGFVSSGTLVIRAQGGHWELVMPDFVFSPSQKTQLAAVRPFRRVQVAPDAGEETSPALYEAKWHGDCRLIFDSRGLLHLLFADRSGPVELTLLCLAGKPIAAWEAYHRRKMVGNADWFLNPSASDLRPAHSLVPLFQRFAALAREATARADGLESMDLIPRSD